MSLLIHFDSYNYNRGFKNDWKTWIIVWMEQKIVTKDTSTKYTKLLIAMILMALRVFQCPIEFNASNIRYQS